ncbi:hypothetical protein ABIC03_000542 [Bradyrhizobium sp. RT6a]
MFGIVSMPRTQIVGNQGLEAFAVGRVVSQLFPALGRLVHRKGDRLANKRLTRLEMIVEAAMRQTRKLHQIDDAEPFGALLA